MEKQTLQQAAENATLSAWSDMYAANTGVDRMLTYAIHRGMNHGYNNPESTQHFKVNFKDEADLLMYGRQMLMEMFQGKRTFASVIKELVECAAGYRAQLLTENK